MSAGSASGDEPVRSLAVWVPDWPLAALGVDPDEPAAVFVANRVVAATPAARSAGVRRQMRRREAQSRSPALAVHEREPDVEGRRFEPVALALESFTPRVEVRRPGLVLFPTRGPSRYFGGDESLADGVHEALGGLTSSEGAASTRLCRQVRIGVADGSFAAVQAARRAADGTVIVPPGGSAEFLAPLPLGAVGDPDLVGVLSRLGMATLGDVAVLPRPSMLGRFGPGGVIAHRLASGDDPYPPSLTAPPPELAVAADVDPPADNVAPLAFLARRLADDVHRGLAARGSVCSRVLVTAVAETGERSERLWRHEGALTAGAIADRVRWQMDGWLQAPAHRRPRGPIVHLEIRPDEVLAASGRQLGFWGSDPGASARAVRAIARVQGLLGAEAVTMAEYVGGRDPSQQLRLVPAGVIDLDGDRAAARPGAVTAPWPGRLPSPSPATVLVTPVPVELLDGAGRGVRIDGRCALSGPPTDLVVDGRRSPVASWAGPWPVDERWWDPERHSRRVRFQVVTADGTARLLHLEGGRWWLAAVYD